VLPLHHAPKLPVFPGRHVPAGSWRTFRNEGYTNPSSFGPGKNRTSADAGKGGRKPASRPVGPCPPARPRRGGVEKRPAAEGSGGEPPPAKAPWGKLRLIKIKLSLRHCGLYPLAGDIEIFLVYLYTDELSAQSLAGDASCPAAHKGIQNFVCGLRKSPDAP